MLLPWQKDVIFKTRCCLSCFVLQVLNVLASRFFFFHFASFQCRLKCKAEDVIGINIEDVNFLQQSGLSGQIYIDPKTVKAMLIALFFCFLPCSRSVCFGPHAARQCYALPERSDNNTSSWRLNKSDLKLF